MKNIIRLLDSLTRENVVGTLFLSQKHRSFEVFIEGDLLYLTRNRFVEKIDLQGLLETGILGEKVTTTTLDTITIGTDLSSTILPEALHSRGLIDDTEFLQLALRQLQEELFARLDLHQDSFHFQESFVPECVVGGDGVTIKNALRLQPFIEFVKRRTERLREVRRLVPDMDEVFVVTEKGMAKKNDPRVDLGHQKIFNLIDGFRTLRSIIDDGQLFPYYVQEGVVESLKEGWIKKTRIPELREVDLEKLTPTTATKYLPLYKNAVKYGVDDLMARERLAELLEKAEQFEEAVVQYNFLGDTLYQLGRKASAIHAYNKGLALRPHDSLVSEKVVRIYLEEADIKLEKGATEEAVDLLRNVLSIQPENRDTAQRLLDVLGREQKLSSIADLCDSAIARSRSDKDPSAGIKFLEQVIEKFPDQPVFHKKLINLYFDFQMSNEALGHMEQLAMFYVKNDKPDSGRVLAEKVLRMDPSRKHLRKYCRTGTVRERLRSKRCRSSRATVKVFLLVLLALAGYQWWTFYELTPVRREQYLAYASPNWVLSKPHGIFQSRVESELEGLAARCLQFEADNPLSVFRVEARVLRNDFLESVRRFREERENNKEAILSRGIKLINRGDAVRARIEFAPLLRCKPGDHWRAKAERALARAADYEREARELRQVSELQRERGDWTKCFESVTELVRKYSLSHAARDVSYPIRIRSVPPGARIESGEVKCDSPCTIEVQPEERRQVTVQLDLFETESLTVRPSDGPELVVELLQEARWRTSDPHFEAQLTVLQGGSVFSVSSRGDLYAFDLASGEQRWSYSLPPVIQPLGPPLALGGYIVLALNNGKLIRFDVETGGGTPLKVDGLISTEPVASRNRNTLFLTTSKNHLLEYSPKTNAVVAIFPLENLYPTRLIGGSSESVLGLDDTNSIFRANMLLGRIEWKSKIHGEIDKGPMIATDRNGLRTIVVTTKRGKLLGLDFKTGSQLWAIHNQTRDYLFLETLGGVLALEKGGTTAVRLNTATGADGEAVSFSESSDFTGRITECPAGIGVLPADGSFYLHDSETLALRWAYASKRRQIRSFCAKTDEIILIDAEGSVAAYSLPRLEGEGQDSSISDH